MNDVERQNERVRTVARNTLISLACKIALIAVMFALQRVMAEILGKANLGIGSVFANIIAILSLADMGLASAITYHLYAPLNRGDCETVRALLKLYAKCYRVIALIVAVCGLVVMTFVHVFLHDSGFPLSYVRGIYLLYVAKAVLSYFFSYRRSLLIADQKVYVVSLIETSAQLLSAALGIAILFITGSFAAYLACDIACNVLGNVTLSFRAGRAYPYIRKAGTGLSDETRRSVFSSVKNVFIMRLSGVILSSTDAIIISSFISTLTAGVYNSYVQITSALNLLVVAVTDAVQPTLGRLYLTEDKRALSDTLSGYTFLFFLCASFAGVSLSCLAIPFVTGIWLTPDYVLPTIVVLIYALVFFTTALRSPLWSMAIVTGLFGKNRDASLAGALTNLILSLLLVKPLGLYGVLVGTLVSQLLQIVLRVRFIYICSLKQSYRAFTLELCAYYLAYIAEAALAFALCALTRDDGIGFLLKMGICVTLPLGMNWILFHRTKRYRMMLSIARQWRSRSASS